MKTKRNVTWFKQILYVLHARKHVFVCCLSSLHQNCDLTAVWIRCLMVCSVSFFKKKSYDLEIDWEKNRRNENTHTRNNGTHEEHVANLQFTKRHHHRLFVNITQSYYIFLFTLFILSFVSCHSSCLRYVDTVNSTWRIGCIFLSLSWSSLRQDDLAALNQIEFICYIYWVSNTLTGIVTHRRCPQPRFFRSI